MITTVDISSIPGWVWPAALAAIWTLLEVRLSKAGFIKKSDLDGLGNRLDKEDKGAKDCIERLERQVITNRTELDATRDRVTKLEFEYGALSDRVLEPIRRIEEKMDRFLRSSVEHETEIRNLKERIREVETPKGGAA